MVVDLELLRDERLARLQASHARARPAGVSVVQRAEHTLRDRRDRDADLEHAAPSRAAPSCPWRERRSCSNIRTRCIARGSARWTCDRCTRGSSTTTPASRLACSPARRSPHCVNSAWAAIASASIVSVPLATLRCRPPGMVLVDSAPATQEAREVKTLAGDRAVSSERRDRDRDIGGVRSGDRPGRHRARPLRRTGVGHARPRRRVHGHEHGLLGSEHEPVACRGDRSPARARRPGVRGHRHGRRRGTILLRVANVRDTWRRAHPGRALDLSRRP